MKRSATLPTSAGPRHGLEFVSIQYLRALAALGVVLWHSSTSLLEHEQYLIPLRACTAGVDIFFLISGVIMYHTTAGRNIRPGQFYIRRLIRIVPPYFVFTTVAFCIAQMAPHLTRTFSPNLWDYLRSIFFIPYWNYGGPFDPPTLIPLMRPEIGQGWTLNFEVFFYFVFGLCLLAPERLRVFSAVSVCFLLVILGGMLHPSSAIFSTYTDPLLLEFVAGVLLGYLIDLKKQANVTDRGKLASPFAWTGILLFLAGISALAAQNEHSWGFTRAIAFGVPAFLIVAGSLMVERAGLLRRVNWLLLLGNASYSLYLMHIFILGSLRRIWQQKFDVSRISTHVPFILIGTVVCEIAAVLFFLYAERPATYAISNYLKRRGIMRDDRQPSQSANERLAAAVPGT